MHCFVYASQLKADSYLWLVQRDDFSVIPPSLTTMLGALRFVLEVELDATRKLPTEDVATVLEHLSTQGWHLQLPPQESLAASNHLPYRQSSGDSDGT